MTDWHKRNAVAFEALGGIATVFAIPTALIVIRYQGAQSDRIQRDQTAREIYRRFQTRPFKSWNLPLQTIAPLKDPNQITAYSAYVQ